MEKAVIKIEEFRRCASVRAIALKPFSRSDCQTLLRWICDLQTLHSWSGGVLATPLDEEELAREFCEYSPSRWPFQRSFMAVERCGGTRVGFVQISEIWPNLSARIGGVLVGDPAARGKGIGGAIVECALNVAFQSFGVDRTDLAVLSSNLAAVRCYERHGFRHVGRWPLACGTPNNPLDLDWMTCYRHAPELACNERAWSIHRQRDGEIAGAHSDKDQSTFPDQANSHVAQTQMLRAGPIA